MRVFGYRSTFMDVYDTGLAQGHKVRYRFSLSISYRQAQRYHRRAFTTKWAFTTKHEFVLSRSNNLLDRLQRKIKESSRRCNTLKRIGHNFQSRYLDMDYSDWNELDTKYFKNTKYCEWRKSSFMQICHTSNISHLNFMHFNYSCNNYRPSMYRRLFLKMLGYCTRLHWVQ